MEKVLISKEEIYKALKAYKFKNTDKVFLKTIKKATIQSIVIEEVKAKLQNGIIAGSITAEGSRENVTPPVFSTILDQNFKTVKFPLLLSGDNYAAWSYALQTGFEEDIAGEYPYTKDKIKSIALKLGGQYFETYISRLNLVMKKVTVTEATFKEDGAPFEHKALLVKITTGLLNGGSMVVGFIEKGMDASKSTQTIRFVG